MATIWIPTLLMFFATTRADEQPKEVRPDWQGNISDIKPEFSFTALIKPKERIIQGWDGSGWARISALMTPSQNDPSDSEPKLALSHSFRNDLGHLCRPDDAWPFMYPLRIVFPPAYIDGKEYFLPIHGHLFQSGPSGEPYDDQTTVFKWIPPSKTPKGISPVRLDSLCIPQKYKQYPAELNFFGLKQEVNKQNRRIELPHMQLWVNSATRQKGDGKLWEAEIECEGYPVADRKRGTVTVREGNILVLPEYGGFVVRHIVPFDAKIRAIGWVDLDCHIIEEKDLEAKAENECREIVRFEMKNLPVTMNEDVSQLEPTIITKEEPTPEPTPWPEWLRLFIFILAPITALGAWVAIMQRYRKRAPD